MMKSHQLINQTSGETEYFTPQFIIDAARAVMGTIDLDPASSAEANKRVRAKSFFTKADDGLRQKWHGCVWLNHPFGRVSNPQWIRKAIQEYCQPEVLHLTCITFAATSEEWFQPLLDYPQCFLCPRTNYLLPDGSLKRGVSKGSVVTYLGRNVNAFAVEFKPFGVIKVRYGIH